MDTRRAWRQTIFYPFALTARHAHGEVLRVEPVTSTYDTPRHGEVPVADVVATRDDNELTLFALNRSQIDSVALRVDLRALPRLRLIDHAVIGGSPTSLLDTNTADSPERVRPRRGDGAVIDGTTLTVPLSPVSWDMLRLEA